MEEMKQDIKDIKKLQGEQNVTLARLTTTVETHEKRSTNLEGRVSKLEKTVWMMMGAASLVGVIIEVWKAFH